MPLPALILTGASGFVGRHLLDEFKEERRIFAIARRSQRQSGAAVHPNIAWMRVDVGDREGLTRAFREIATAGGASQLVHLAAYYDFTGDAHPAYERTNVEGTRLVLEGARQIGVSDLVFASSVAACGFPRPEGAVTEATPPDGKHLYARSKCLGERVVRESVAPHAVIARFGAIYSDWCEYPPLYVFLSTWLGRSWRRAILAGRGQTGIPYVHVRDVVAFFRRLLPRLPELDHGEVLVASSTGDTTHRELFSLATRAFFGEVRHSIHMPAPLCLAGVRLQDGLGRLVGRRPFERPWMIRYVDQRLRVDNARTQARLGWTPSRRYRVERRLPFMVEHMRAEPYLWFARNQALLHRQPPPPDLLIYEALAAVEDQVVRTLLGEVLVGSPGQFGTLHRLDSLELEWQLRLLYRLLLTSVQTANRMLLLDYVAVTCPNRFAAGDSPEDLQLLLERLSALTRQALLRREDLRPLRMELHNRIAVPIGFAVDEVREQAERYREAAVPAVTATAEARQAREALEDTIWQCLVTRH